MSHRKKRSPSAPAAFTFARKVDLWATDHKMSLRAIATACGFEPATFYRWVRKGTKLPVDALLKFAEFAQLPPWYWVDQTAPYPPDKRVVSAESVFQAISEAEKEALAHVLADPDERRAWLASWSARRARPK